MKRIIQYKKYNKLIGLVLGIIYSAVIPINGNLLSDTLRQKYKEKVMSDEFIVLTTYDIANVEIEEHIGLVQGSTVRSRNFGSDFLATLKNLVGGELVGYSKLLETSREQAYSRMVADAKSKGANGILGFRFQTSTVAQGAAEILAYGTAVKIKKV